MLQKALVAAIAGFMSKVGGGSSGNQNYLSATAVFAQARQGTWS